MKLYIEQRKAQVLNLFIYLLLPYMFRTFLAHFQRQVYNFGSGSSLLGMVSALGRLWKRAKTSETCKVEVNRWIN
jgi:hypothetical protein